VLVLATLAVLARPLAAKEEMLPDMTGSYDFLGADDSLGLLEEEERLRGYIDVAQGEDESDSILSYQLEGTRKVNHVEFKTKTIHRKYYRFSGRVQRGEGKAEKDPDYLRLAGTLEIVTIEGETGEESVERRNVLFKSRPPQVQTEEDEYAAVARVCDPRSALERRPLTAATQMETAAVRDRLYNAFFPVGIDGLARVAKARLGLG